MSDAPTNLIGLSRSSFEAFMAELGQKPFRARQLMKWIYHQGVTDFSGMTDLSMKLRAELAERACVELPRVAKHAVSKDGTQKWVVEAANGNQVETVLIPEKGRNTLCVSSQVGCVLDCSFCATGKQGFNGNLTTAEIIGQVMIANAALEPSGEAVTNVVMMGMGEPLLNFDPVVEATDLMMDDLAFGISKRRVTISTAGMVPRIYDLAQITDVSLAISLHAPTDALRDQLVPINRRYPIQSLMDACLRYLEGMGEKRSLTMEYTLLRGVNDGLEHAKALAELLQPIRCKINLIPFNPFPGSGYERPETNSIREFQTYLMNAGYATMLRTTRGEDIEAACGQLVGQVTDRTRRNERFRAKIAALEVA